MNLKLGIVVACVALALTDVSQASCSSAQKAGPPPKSDEPGQQGRATPSPSPAGGEVKEMKVLAEGAYGKVEEPFVVVARGRETYAALRGMVEGLPELGEEFFETGAVVAAFLGTRNSGGYAVEIAREGEGPLVITERTPPKGAMTTMALTQPYKVVAVPDAEGRLAVEVKGGWGSSLFRSYKVEAGEIEVTGGIAGRVSKYALEGGLNVARREGLVTVAFDVRGAGAMRERTMKTLASGVAQPDGGFEMVNVNPGTLVEHPRSPLRLGGRPTEGGNRLKLDFETLPLNIPDGFSGRGRLEAVAQGKP